jgi:hypothetical protein
LATISALSASFSARVRLRAGFSTTTSFPFLFSRPISNKQIVEHLVSADRVLLRRRGGVEHGGTWQGVMA